MPVARYLHVSQFNIERKKGRNIACWKYNSLELGSDSWTTQDIILCRANGVNSIREQWPYDYFVVIFSTVGDRYSHIHTYTYKSFIRTIIMYTLSAMPPLSKYTDISIYKYKSTRWCDHAITPKKSLSAQNSNSKMEFNRPGGAQLGYTVIFHFPSENPAHIMFAFMSNSPNHEKHVSYTKNYGLIIFKST